MLGEEGGYDGIVALQVAYQAINKCFGAIEIDRFEVEDAGRHAQQTSGFIAAAICTSTVGFCGKFSGLLDCGFGVG